MVRLTVLLAAGLYVVMLFGGEDRGQTRLGLMNVQEPRVVAQAPEPITPREPLAIAQVSPAAFVPPAPLMEAPVAEVVAAVSEQPAPSPAALRTDSRIMTVIATSANVRGGPGTGYSVMGRVTRGESVLVLASPDLPQGWSHIRVEGDGIDGYIATRLLAE